MSVPSINSVAFKETDIELTLTDGLIVRQALLRHLRLSMATAEQRAAWTLLDDGLQATWPQLRGTIDVHDLLWDELCKRAHNEAKDKAFKPEELPPSSREIVALYRLEADIYNGGFLQYPFAQEREQFWHWPDLRYPVPPQSEKTMAIQAQRNRARLHVLRDNVHRAKRDVKRKLPGAVERLKAHRATRLAYAENAK